MTKRDICLQKSYKGQENHDKPKEHLKNCCCVEWIVDKKFN